MTNWKLVEPIRIRHLNDAPVRARAAYVLYWAQVNRRVDSNHALAYAAGRANDLGLPLLMFEGLTFDHPHASPRINQFILDGVAENARRAAKLGIGYRGPDRRNDTFYRLAAKAACVVTDDFPGYMASTHNARVPARIGIPYDVVDASCIVPMAAIGKQEYAAYTIRPKINRLLPEYLRRVEMPKLKHRWPGPAREYPEATGMGGRLEADRRMRRFLRGTDPHSHLSPHIHFGHISTLEMALAVRDRPEFLEQLIVRRELAFNFARYGPDPHTLDALPNWARATLAKHNRDKREHVYTFERFEQAATDDPIWNAAQCELLRDGVIQSYQRMYWGKKIIQWSRTHREALNTMIRLHDTYALDGRDPNTYANILWCFGLHDRPWQERPVFGMIRYMSSEGIRRNTDVGSYIRRMS